MAHPQPKAKHLQQLWGCLLVFTAATRHPPNSPGLLETCCSLLFSEKVLATEKTEVQANKEPQGEKWQAAAGAGG